MEGEGCSNTNGADGSLRQDQESGSGEECGGVVAAAGGEEGTRVLPGMQRSRPLPRESPPTPPTSMYATTAAGAGAGADAAAPGARPGSLRPSVSGLLAENSSGIFSRQREDRADSLGDRYKGTNAFRRQHQQHAARTSITRNAGYGAGDRYGERSGTRRPSHQLGAAGRAGSSSTANSGAGVGGSSQGGGGGGGGGAERSIEREGRHGGGASAGRRRGRRVVDRGREWEATAKEEVLGEGGEERRKQNGRVAQIADGMFSYPSCSCHPGNDIWHGYGHVCRMCVGSVGVIGRLLVPMVYGVGRWGRGSRAIGVTVRGRGAVMPMAAGRAFQLPEEFVLMSRPVQGDRLIVSSIIAVLLVLNKSAVVARSIFERLQTLAFSAAFITQCHKLAGWLRPIVAESTLSFIVRYPL